MLLYEEPPHLAFSFNPGSPNHPKPTATWRQHRQVIHDLESTERLRHHTNMGDSRNPNG